MQLLLRIYVCMCVLCTYVYRALETAIVGEMGNAKTSERNEGEGELERARKAVNFWSGWGSYVCPKV